MNFDACSRARLSAAATTGTCNRAATVGNRRGLARCLPTVLVRQLSLVGGLALWVTCAITAQAANATVSPPNNRIPDTLLASLPRANDESGFRPLFGQDTAEGWAQCGPGHVTMTNGVATSHGGMGLWWHTNPHVHQPKSCHEYSQLISITIPHKAQP